MGTEKTDVLRVAVGPSCYHIAQDGSAKLLKWQIGLADSSWREIISAESNFSCQFNVRALPISGFHGSEVSQVEFACRYTGGESVVFEPKNPSQCRACIPRISYKLTDLTVAIEVALDSVCTFPLHWCPVICIPICLPWHPDLSLDQYSLRSRAKKKLILNDDFSVIESEKYGGNLPIILSDSNILAISGIQDYTASIATKNEEENLSVIFCGKYPNAYFAVKLTPVPNCTELICMADLPNYDENSKNWANYRCIQPGKTDAFALKLSVC
jgi:hypothetical protein